MTQPTFNSADVPFSPEQVRISLDVLRWAAKDASGAAALPELGQAIARAYKRGRREQRRQAARGARGHDDSAPVGSPPILPPANSEQGPCYICGRGYHDLHFHYQRLCPTCAAENYIRRSRRADLAGRWAIITGGRIKIGYQTALRFLRDGGHVIVTTRFPRDAARRYGAEPDFGEWQSRLALYALDLRDLRAVHAFADHLCASLNSLEILINNAAQTIRRPDEAYRDLHALETGPLAALPSDIRLLLKQISGVAPPARLTPPWSDAVSLAQVRDAVPATVSPMPRSTWAQPLEEVATAELAEVMMVNAMAPFVLCGRLEALMRRSPCADRHIVNVSAIEGRFGPAPKLPWHPHTNMAKAALNMLTRTAAVRCAEHGIYMNSVDPGWVTRMRDVDPRSAEEGHALDMAESSAGPLDEIDAAARIYDPILRGMEGRPIFGLFLKDYTPVPW